MRINVACLITAFTGPIIHGVLISAKADYSLLITCLPENSSTHTCLKIVVIKDNNMEGSQKNDIWKRGDSTVIY